MIMSFDDIINLNDFGYKETKKPIPGHWFFEIITRITFDDNEYNFKSKAS